VQTKATPQAMLRKPHREARRTEGNREDKDSLHGIRHPPRKVNESPEMVIRDLAQERSARQGALSGPDR